jgi:glucose/arabinose dehydrogenase
MSSRFSLCVLVSLTLVLAACGGSSGGGGNPPPNAAPTVSGVAPSSGPAAGGTAITISGTGFLSGATVSVGGTAATGVSVVSSSSITATAPAHAGGAATVKITNSDGQSSSQTVSFTYNAAPTVTSIAPNSGPTSGGTAVTITGAGFVSGPTGTTVSIGSTPATAVVVASSTSITATTPAHAAGQADVVVTNPDSQTGTVAGGFTYNPPPSVTSISPSLGSTLGGTAVTIAGTNFVSGATVQIGSAAATSVTVASTSITAITPAGTAGPANVTVTNPDNQSNTLANAFTYAVQPNPSSIMPLSGSTLGGTAVTISGTGFLTGATVTIGGVPATGVSVMNSTTINATTAAHVGGLVDVVVTNLTGLSGPLQNAFNYVVTPVVSSVSPIDGLPAGGTVVTITGQNFAQGATVTFGGAAATGVTVNSATQITATTPAKAAVTVPVPVDVTVTNPDKTNGTLAGGFIYTPGPTLTSISPNSMGTGTPSFQLTAYGSNFTPASVLNFSGTPLTTTYLNQKPNQITGIVPAADIPTVGSVPVTVTDVGVTSSTQFLIIRNPIKVVYETLSIPGLNRPTRIAFAPEGTLYIAEQGTFGATSEADILRVSISGGVGTVLKWASLPVNPGNINFGLLGMALDPNNPPSGSGGDMYIFYTFGTGVAGAENRVATIGIGAIAPTDLITGLPVATSPDPLNLNGGKIAVYPNSPSSTNYLYVSTGGSDQNPGLSQTTPGRYGKILRYKTDGSIPSTNPFGSSDPTYVCGFRDSVGFDFHPTAGTLYADDNGNGGSGTFPWFDGLDRALAGDSQGFGFTTGAPCTSTVTNPIWSKSVPVIQPTGMIFYNSTVLPQLQNSILMVGGQATSGSHIVYQFEVDEYDPANPGRLMTPNPVGVIAINPSGTLSDITQGPDGCVYIADSGNNAIYRLRPTTSSPCK